MGAGRCEVLHTFAVWHPGWFSTFTMTKRLVTICLFVCIKKTIGWYRYYIYINCVYYIKNKYTYYTRRSTLLQHYYYTRST